VIVGLDIDNTLLDYRPATFLAASDVFKLDLNAAGSRSEMKDAIVSAAGELAWTEIQGRIYGDYSIHTVLYPRVKEFLKSLAGLGHQPRLISHKTERPIVGGGADLRAYALQNLQRLGVFSFGENFIRRDQVVFCETKEEKIRAIVDSKADLFIDDLFGILARVPNEICRIHMYCASNHPAATGLRCVNDWSELKCTSNAIG